MSVCNDLQLEDTHRTQLDEFIDTLYEKLDEGKPCACCTNTTTTEGTTNTTTEGTTEGTTNTTTEVDTAHVLTF